MNYVLYNSFFFYHTDVRLLRFYIWWREIHSSSSTSRLLPYRISFIKIYHSRARTEVFLNTRPCFHSQNIKLSPVSLRPRSSVMQGYVLSDGQIYFVSHMFAMLQSWFFGTDFSNVKLYRSNPSSLLYNAKNSQPPFILNLVLI